MNALASPFNELKHIINKQKSLLTDLEALSEQYDVKELISQNKALSEEIVNCRKEISSLTEKCRNLSAKNEDLNLKLTEQILDEKRNILKISKGKMENEGLSEEQIQKRIRHNNFEIKIGIFLIILGAATALRYTYSR